jgi:hypothetical protein
MATPDFPLKIDRRRLLTAAAGFTATGIVQDVKPANSAVSADVAQPSTTCETAPANVSAATACRLLEIARRNELRREANLPLLPISRELRKMKEQETQGEFERFVTAYGKAVWDEVLKTRPEAEGPDWRLSWMEGVGYQSGVRKILWQQFTTTEWRKS